MNKQPFFTIGIPVYNVEKYLSKCLDSVLCQSFDDFEIIAVDDGSPDGSIDILDSYAEKDSRIKIIRRANCGVSAARNTVITFAEGRYLFFLDSDDFMLEDVLQQAFDSIVKNDYPDVLNTGYLKTIGDKRIEYHCEHPGSEYHNPDVSREDNWIRLWSSRKTVDLIMTKFFSTEFLQKSGIMFSNRLVANEDSEFIFNVNFKAEKVAYADFFSFHYYKSREGSVSTVWSYKAIASVFSRWHNFFYCDSKFFNLTAEGRKALKLEKERFLTSVRYGIIGLPLYRSDDEIEKLVCLLEDFFEKDIRRLPVGRSSHAPVYLLYRLIGIRKTVSLLKIAVKILKKK
ncbi:MAG: glycosyltransferase [Oscillospiraceae bacterium]|nr:glycosyltransferase [Oscillospiraceae bacterium]